MEIDQGLTNDQGTKSTINNLVFMHDTVSFIPLGGVGDVTKNMYVYQYKDEILLVDCGLGFADETMLGVDLLLPDITYLLQTKKKIVGMVLTHGHEDHMGGLPFILPQLLPANRQGSDFPIYGSPVTAAFANSKLQEFRLPQRVQEVKFGENKEIHMGNFSISLIRVTHSIPDTAHLLIKTPAGNLYHGADYKFDLTPADGKKTDFAGIVHAGDTKVLAMMSDALGSEREGYTASEEQLGENFEQAMKGVTGKCIITTYSSHITRLDQAIKAGIAHHRKICFIGRSLIKAVEVGKRLGLLHIPKGMEIRPDQAKHVKDNDLLLIVAGSQGQENSALTRIAGDLHSEIKLRPGDLVIFSADPIPGNEAIVHDLVDTIAKKGVKVLYSALNHNFHVSGHGSAREMMLLMSLVRPSHVVPIGGTYAQMVAYRDIAKREGYTKDKIHLLEDGQEIIFSKEKVMLGQKLAIRNVYVDEISGEEVESYVLRDRQRLSTDGIVIVMAEIDSATGGISGTPDVITRGFSEADTKDVRHMILHELQRIFPGKGGRVTNWTYVRNSITEAAEKTIAKHLKRRPLVLPVVIEM